MTPQPEAGDIIGQALFILTILGGLLTTVQRGKSLTNFFQRIAKFALAKEIHDPAPKGTPVDRDYLLALHTSESARIGSIDKKVDDVKEEIEEDFDKLTEKMRGMFDSVVLGMSTLKREINHKIEVLEDNLAKTNQRMDILAQMVNSKADRAKEQGVDGGGEA